MNAHATASVGSPFHEGEWRLQESVGLREKMEGFGRRVIRDFMPEQHREFFRSLPFVVLAARDVEGFPWASAVAGPVGFIDAPDERTLSVRSTLLRGDALEGALTPGSDLGLLGIDLAARRRNRANGRVFAADTTPGDNTPGDTTFRVAIEQSFGNCPKYIRPRLPHAAERAIVPGAGVFVPPREDHLGTIRASDTFFIASGHRGDGERSSFGMDASHRGGEPGFVDVVGSRLLRVPDYAGNKHFNTLGNVVMDPRVGLLFVDFDSGALLQVSATASVVTDSAIVGRYPGAERVLELGIDKVVQPAETLPLRWTEA